MDELKLSVASSPHASHPVGTKSLMRDVLIALIPAMAMGIYVFGFRALIQTIVSVIFCEIFEWGYCKLMHKPNPIKDLSAAITGVLLVFVCPTWALPGQANWAPLGMSVGQDYIDSFTGATPLSIDFMKNADDALNLTTSQFSLGDMFIGNIGGTVGEVSAIALLIGGIYLICRGVIRPRIPVAYIATVAVLTLIFSRSGSHFDFVWMLREIFGGGLFLGAFFMATDYVTSPNTPKGEIIFGIGAGLLVVFIRYFGGYPEGVCYSILVMNICVWLIDKATMPARFGVTKEMRQAEKEAAKAAKKAAKEGSEA